MKKNKKDLEAILPIEELHREIQTRERIIQVFLIISGFLVAYSNEGIKSALISIFGIYVTFAILYYIFLTRTQNYHLVDALAIIKSYSFCLFFLIFINSYGKLSDLSFLTSFIALTAIFSFAFISPQTSKKMVFNFNKKSEEFEKNHPRLVKGLLIISVIMSIIFLGYIYYYYYFQQ